MARKKNTPAEQPPPGRPEGSPLRNRIVGHRTVRAGDLRSHPLNPRTHSDEQRQALSDLLGEVGFARSALAYVADADKGGRWEMEGHLDELVPLTLIDGHLRKDTLPNEMITVEILDVNDEEARKLLLSIDPLSAMASYNEEALAQLQQDVQTSSDHLQNLWQGIARANEQALRELDRQAKERKEKPTPTIVDTYLVIIECRDEVHQRDVLRFCRENSMECSAKMC